MNVQKGQRYSKQRESILHILEGTDSHPTAAWVYDKVRQELPNISLGTVYRNLSRLCEEGLVLKLDVGDGTERYDATFAPHYHLFCKKCNCICDIHTDYDEQLNAKAASENGCRIDYHTLLFSGICPDCVKAEG